MHIFHNFFIPLSPQLIFSGEYTKAMENDWHSGHFACFNCDMSLTGHRYILRDEHPYCIKCYETQFANACEECKTPIGTDSKVRSHDVCASIRDANLLGENQIRSKVINKTVHKLSAGVGGRSQNLVAPETLL